MNLQLQGKNSSWTSGSFHFAALSVFGCVINQTDLWPILPMTALKVAYGGIVGHCVVTEYAHKNKFVPESEQSLIQCF